MALRFAQVIMSGHEPEVGPGDEVRQCRLGLYHGTGHETEVGPKGLCWIGSWSEIGTWCQWVMSCMVLWLGVPPRSAAPAP